jgi:hypothetical protein
MTAMKTGVKAGDLRYLRQAIEDGLNRGEVVRLM